MAVVGSPGTQYEVVALPVFAQPLIESFAVGGVTLGIRIEDELCRGIALQTIETFLVGGDALVAVADDHSGDSFAPLVDDVTEDFAEGCLGGLR